MEAALNKAVNISQDTINNMYSKMVMIRNLEETLLELFSKGELFGTTHTSIGQEANAVASMAHIKKGDVVFSNHRCHGHYIAYGGPVSQLIAEVMGRVTGVVGGRGGSQHICYNDFYTNGIQGGIVGNATGAALANKLKGTDNIAVVFLGDGTLGEGLVYESMNFASLWDIPILFILENNRYASQEIQSAIKEAKRSEYTSEKNIEFENITDISPENESNLIKNLPEAKKYRGVHSLNNALHELFNEDGDVLLIEVRIF